MSEKVVRCGYCGLYDCRCDASELRAERDALAERVGELEKTNRENYKWANELDAANAKLRAALERIAGQTDERLNVGAIVRAALEER